MNQMPKSMIDELAKIAQTRPSPFFSALDKMAGSSASYAGDSPAASAAMSPAAVGTPAPPPVQGSTNIPGASIHCNNCRAKVTPKDVKGSACPKCGAPLKPHVDLTEKGAPEDRAEHTPDSGDEGGGQKAELEEQTNMDDEYQKSAGAKRWKAYSNLAKGVLALSAGGYGAVKARKFFGGASKGLPKHAAARLRIGNPILRIRKPSFSKPSKAVRALRRRTKRSSKGLVQKHRW